VPQDSWYDQPCQALPGATYDASIWFRNLHSISHSLGVWVGLYQGGSPQVLANYQRTLISTNTATSTSQWFEVVSPQLTATGGTIYVAFGCRDDNAQYSGADRVAVDDVAFRVVSAPPAGVPGDFDHDGDVDLLDVNAFIPCMSGAAVAYSPGCAPKDLDGDGDADQSDFGILQKCVSGTGIAADANCAN
jgi:hypothetical protein